jgi:hypothetical protein
VGGGGEHGEAGDNGLGCGAEAESLGSFREPGRPETWIIPEGHLCQYQKCFARSLWVRR